MGNFQQHITCSTATGIAVAGVAYHFGFDMPTCLVAAGLCSFAGMLPDIDSNSSKSFQECIYLTAGVACILAAAKFRNYVEPDLAMLGGAVVFLLIRFGLGTFLKKYTSHRGTIHSIPMAIICGQLIFFAVPGDVAERLVKAAALTIGFLSHLVLDEVCSIDSSGSSIRLKKSFGTALKWTNPKKKGLVTALYGLILFLGYGIYAQPGVMELANDRMEMIANDIQLPQMMSGEPEHCEIRQAAAEFLSQFNVPAATAQALPQPSYQSQTETVLPEQSTPEPQLPSAMQISNELNHLVLPQPFPRRPAPIIVK